MKKIILIVAMILTSTNLIAQTSCWEIVRRQWIREPSKDRQFEEYVAIIAAHFAYRFYSCLSSDCAKVREQNDNKVSNYVDSWITDTLLVKHYYDMEWYFEDQLSTLDFRHWKQNNQSWQEGRNWREYEKNIGGCSVPDPTPEA
ncbi:MAG: hypothetical protein OXC31_30410 [Spirochaetaceae bacterium]|nr:hypothetical protein [Spirochaetaceae bacterium]